MQLIEHDGKTLLARHGIAVLPRLLLAPDDFPGAAIPLGPRLAVKAQVFAGGRGKEDLVQITTPELLQETVDAIRERLVVTRRPAWIMIEPAVDIRAEFYMALAIDDVQRCPVLLFSPQGGMEVEAAPATMAHLPIDPLAGMVAWRVTQFLRDAGLPADLLGTATRFAMSLWRAWCAEEAELIEVNPLALTADKKLLALDAKVRLDEQAGARHPDRVQLPSHHIEQAQNGPRKTGSTDTYVEMPGDIGMLTGGAGLGMATLDMLADAGLRAATFVDGSGGADPAIYENKAHLVLNRAKDPAIKGVLIYFTLAAASLAPIARGTLKALRDNPIGKPIVVGIVAAAAAEAEMTAAQARAAFIDAGFPFHAELDDAIATLATRIRAGA